MIVTQEQVDKMIVQLADQIRASSQHFDRVVGIERGGLHVSEPLAKMLNLPHESLYISCYKGQVKRAKPIVHGTLPIGGRSLVIDDIVDTGETIETYRLYCGPNFKVATLFWKVGSPKPKFYVATKPDEWVTFYWELAYENTADAR